MSAIVVSCHRPFVVLASHQPYAHLHVSLALTDMPAMDWIYVVYKDKRIAVSVPCTMFSRVYNFLRTEKLSQRL